MTKYAPAAMRTKANTQPPAEPISAPELANKINPNSRQMPAL